MKKYEPRNARLEKLIHNGWRPSVNGEYIDLYNQKTDKNISGTVLTRVFNANHYFVTIKYEPQNHTDCQG